jgi:hypothetical protein
MWIRGIRIGIRIRIRNTVLFWFSFYSPDYIKMHLNQVKTNSNGYIKLMRIGNTAYNLDITWQNCVCVVIDRKYAGYAVMLREGRRQY